MSATKESKREKSLNNPKIIERFKDLFSYFRDTQTGFGTKFGVSQSFVGDILGGRKGISAKFLLTLALEGVNINWLLTGEGTMFLKGREPYYVRPYRGGEVHEEGAWGEELEEVEFGPHADARMMHFLDYLERTRGVTMEAIARAIGVSPTHLRDLEQGKEQPSLQTLLLLEAHYGLNRLWLQQGGNRDMMRSTPSEMTRDKERIIESNSELIEMQRNTIRRLEHRLKTLADAVNSCIKDPLPPDKIGERLNTWLMMIYAESGS